MLLKIQIRSTWLRSCDLPNEGLRRGWVQRTNYAKTSHTWLHLGVMFASSAWTTIDNGRLVDMYKKTTSNIPVVQIDTEPFISVTTQSFETDRLVHHPYPRSGSVISQIVEHLPGIGIFVVKRETGLRYTNRTSGTETNPEGINALGISPCYSPHLWEYSLFDMVNSYSGYAG